MSLQDQCGHFATPRGVVYFVPSCLTRKKGQSREQLILVYFDNDKVCVSLIYIMWKTINMYPKHKKKQKKKHDNDFSIQNPSHI